MSSSTLYFNYILQDLGEEADVNILYDNMWRTSRDLKRMDNSLTTGRDNRKVIAINKTSTGTALAQNTWRRLYGTSAWTAHYAAGDNSVGWADLSTFGRFEIYMPGYYRFTWNVRIAFSAATHTEGEVLTALFQYDITDVTKALPHTFACEAADTQDGIQDIGHSIILKVTESDDPTGDLFVTGTMPNPATTDPEYSYAIAWKHKNDGSLTAAEQATGTWFEIEWLRPL